VPILDPQAPPTEAPAPTQQAVDPGKPEVDSSEQPNVSPEEQKQYDEVVTAALSLVYDPQGFPTTVKKLVDMGDRPAFAIGHTAAMLLKSVNESVKKSGAEISDDILFAAAQEIVSDLTDIAVGAGVISKEQGDSIGEEAFYEGMKVWGQYMQDSGQITPEKQQEARNALKEAGQPDPEAMRQQQPQQAPAQPAPADGILGAQ
jgi:hypothetical protein